MLLQAYPDLEYIIIDGGSTDGSVDIIRKYAPWLTAWVAEPDDGRTHALKKGFDGATGSFVAWLNTDDTYMPDALYTLVASLVSHTDAAMAFGHCNKIDPDGKILGAFPAVPLTSKRLVQEGNQIAQPASMMRAESFLAAGGVDRRFNYVMDFDLWLRLGLQGELLALPQYTANFGFHADSKTVSSGYFGSTMQGSTSKCGTIFHGRSGTGRHGF